MKKYGNTDTAALLADINDQAEKLEVAIYNLAALACDDRYPERVAWLVGEYNKVRRVRLHINRAMGA